MLFRMCVLNASVLLWQIVLKVELKLLLPLVFLIPTYGGISYTTVVLSAYMFLVGTFLTPAIIVTYKLLSYTADEMTDRWLTNFFIRNYLPDTRKNKEFAYDARYIKRLDSFSKTQVVQEEDRFLHQAGIGATGTGKTSTIASVVYESDLQQKVYNTDYQKKRVEELLRAGKAKMIRYFEDIDFNIDYIAGDGEDAEEVDKELAKLKLMAASAGQTMFCKRNCIYFEIILPDKHDCRPDAWNNEDYDQCGGQSLGAFADCLILILCRTESEIFDTDICSKHNERAVDYKQIQSTEEVTEFTTSKPITGCAEWWHQGCRNCHSGKYCSLILSALFQNAGKTAKKGYQNIIECRRCPG